MFSIRTLEKKESLNAQVTVYFSLFASVAPFCSVCIIIAVAAATTTTHTTERVNFSSLSSHRLLLLSEHRQALASPASITGLLLLELLSHTHTRQLGVDGQHAATACYVDVPQTSARRRSVLVPTRSLSCCGSAVASHQYIACV